MDDLFSRVSEVLSDPQAAEKIRQVAASLSQGKELPDLPVDAAESAAGEGASSSDVPGGIGKVLATLNGGGKHGKEIDLLRAVKPYLRDSRAERVDGVIRAIRMLDMLSGLQ